MAVAEKMKVAELMLETSFIQKRQAELQSEALKVEEEQAKTQARVVVFTKKTR